MRDRIVQSSRDYYEWYQEWRLQCQDIISGLKAKGLLDDARELKKRLNDQPIYSNPGTFKMMWTTGFGNEVFQFTGISNRQEKQSQPFSLDSMNESSTTAGSDASSDSSSDTSGYSSSDWGSDPKRNSNGQLANSSMSEDNTSKDNKLIRQSQVNELLGSTTRIPCRRCWSRHKKCNGDNCQPSRKPFSHLSVGGLQTECRKRHLPINGNKRVLISRLTQHDLKK
ncbi:hypothetical protein GGR58DRAFT_285441 [Xylaria digitata]|nr:hypothetical protein GGR58DRAFT_285441 [Xylaria digitata]